MAGFLSRSSWLVRTQGLGAEASPQELARGHLASIVGEARLHRQSHTGVRVAGEHCCLGQRDPLASAMATKEWRRSCSPTRSRPSPFNPTSSPACCTARSALRRDCGLPRVVENTRASRWVTRTSRLACRERRARSSRSKAGRRARGQGWRWSSWAPAPPWYPTAPDGDGLRVEVHIAPGEAQRLGHPQSGQRTGCSDGPERVRHAPEQPAHLLTGQVPGFRHPLNARPVIPVKVAHRVVLHHAHPNAVPEQARGDVDHAGHGAGCQPLATHHVDERPAPATPTESLAGWARRWPQGRGTHHGMTLGYRP